MPTSQERKSKMPAQRGTALFRPESINRQDRTVEVVMTTGESGKRYDWYNDRHYMEELQIDEKSVRTARLDKGIPLIPDHNKYSGIGGVMGVTEDYRFENGELVGTVRFSKREEVDKIFDDVADGILRNVSLGYKVHKYEKTRGEDGELDTYRAVDLEPLELSLVAIPFETTNGVRAEQRDNEETYEVTIVEESNMPKEHTKDNVTADENRSEQTPVEKPVVAEKREAETPVEKDEPQAQSERELLQPMLNSARKAGLDDQFAIRHFNDGLSVADFNQRVLDEIGKQSEESAPNTTGTGMPVLNADKRSDQAEQTRSGVENAILNRADSSIELSDGGKNFRGATLMDMARQMLNSRGLDTMGMSPMQVAQRAMSSTSDFPLILENVMNKSLLGGYMEIGRTFQSLGRRTTASDFRAKNVYRLGDSPDLLPLNEHGEYKSSSLTEGKESYAIDTYARKFSVTRKTLINDDLDALSRLPSMWGASAARLQNKIVWGLILNYDFDKQSAAGIVMEDGKAVFHNDHNNLLGAGSALSKTSLSDMRKMGRNQKTLNNNKMNIQYNTLVVPTALETTAEELLLSTIYPAEGQKAQINMRPQIIVDPWLDEVSETAWYMFANTNVIDTFEYAFLAGEEELYTEVNTQTDVDGLEVKARTDFGCGWIDHRGVGKATGAA